MRRVGGLASMHQQLVNALSRLVLLQTPTFDKHGHNRGYMAG